MLLHEEQGFGLIAGRYRLRDKIGHGGMGRVWLAHDEMLGRDVAIKEVSPPPHVFAVDKEHLRGVLLREAKAAGRISHPGVVKIHDVIETEGWPWLVMEYVPSINLQVDIDLKGPLPWAEVARIGLALLEALVAAHNSGVLHRDVKPANVLLCDDRRVVLGDFGLASLDPDGKVSLAAGLGTPQFLAPERAQHGISSREADFWSLGATLYAAVEGRSPYARKTMLETFSALASSDPDPMELAGPLGPVLLGLLARDPAKRTAPELLRRQLQAVMEGQIVDKPPAVRQPARVKRMVLGGAVVVAAVAAGVILGPASRGRVTSPGGVPTGRPLPVVGIPGCETPRAQLPPPNQPPNQAADQAQSPPLVQTPAPGQNQPVPGPGVPDGWILHWDPTGFTVAVPERWDRWLLANNTVCFKGPDDGRILGVMPHRPLAESLQDYREISQKEVQLRGPAIEWEFTYLWRDRKRHAIAIVKADRTLFWITNDADFAPSRASYEVARSWFGLEVPRPAFS